MCTRPLAILALGLTLAGCDGGEISWQIAFEEPADRAEAVFVVARIREGSCTGVARYEASAARGAQIAAPVPELDGVHGVEAVAIDATCREVASACELRDLSENEGDISLTMLHMDVPRVRCLGELCTAGSCQGCGTSACADLGEPCNSLTLCANDFLCNAGTCSLSAAGTRLCAEAPIIALDAATPMRTTAGLIEAGPNVLGATSCGGAEDVPEIFYEVTIAPGEWDLVLTTADTMPPLDDFDSVVYVHAVCGDRRTELACNDDDTTTGSLLSRVELLDAGGRTVWVGVQQLDFAGPSVPFELVSRLRPIRATGEACDPMFIADRCAATPCNATARCP